MADAASAEVDIRLHVWRAFPPDLQELLRIACLAAWKLSHSWSDQDLQRRIEAEARAAFGPSSVRADVRLSELGVIESQAQIDLVITGSSGGVLVQLAGHTGARHEKELLECISVSLANAEFTRAAFIVCSTNQLVLEGRRSSFDYCRGALLKLAEPALNSSGLEGLMIVGLPTPIPVL